jgi:dTDP-4-amino-4,6-dideoxygalactose transaminase
MAQGAHKITEQFEQELCKYTGAPYAVAVDNCSNALFLALYYELNVKKSYKRKGYNVNTDKPIITIPRHTYPSVPCEIIHAGGKVAFWDDSQFDYCSLERNMYGCIEGSYQLYPTCVYDSALSFTANMYKGGHMCVSFTGPYKHLKLGKGGAILTDDREAYEWFKRARFSGRQECSYHYDDFDQEYFVDLLNEGKQFIVPAIAGWNFYMMPEIAARGILLMQQFYNADGTPKHNDDLCMKYPDLSKFKVFNQ